MKSRLTLVLIVFALCLTVVSQAQFGFPVDINLINTDLTSYDLKLSNSGTDPVNIVSDIAESLDSVPLVSDNLSTYFQTNQVLTLNSGDQFDISLHFQNPTANTALYLFGDNGQTVGFWTNSNNLPVPEPSTIPIFGACIFGAGVFALRRK